MFFHTGPHFRNERTTENWAYGHFYTKLGIYQYGRERWLRSNLTSGLSSCTQVFELAWIVCSIDNFGELYNYSILLISIFLNRQTKLFFPFQGFSFICANSSINNRPWGITHHHITHLQRLCEWRKTEIINRATQNIFILINRLTK